MNCLRLVVQPARTLAAAPGIALNFGIPLMAPNASVGSGDRKCEVLSGRTHPRRSVLEPPAPLLAWRQTKLRLIAVFFRAFLISIALLTTACADLPVRSEQIASDAGFLKQHLQGNPYEHIAFVGPEMRPDKPLHVYLSGDGTPWIGRTRIAYDPTPRNPIALRLMALDRSPRIFLGRPCYQGLSGSPGCNPFLWTGGRYSEAVVVSMTAALRRFIDENGYRDVVLIGYSGGGVLAWLIAERLEQVRLLVTIAANLDIDAWTTLHGYTPLMGSLNPASRGAALPERVAQLHLVGSRDTNVPPSLVRSAMGGAGRLAAVRTVPSDHRCCWESHWPDILDAIEDVRARRSTIE
jgi:pimeloyl-ACP methyl ester carboxylesterase